MSISVRQVNDPDLVVVNSRVVAYPIANANAAESRIVELAFIQVAIRAEKPKVVVESRLVALVEADTALAQPAGRRTTEVWAVPPCHCTVLGVALGDSRDA